jgi:hypothetical protein
VALARSESPRGSTRNAATSVPLEEAYEAPVSVMFVLFVGTVSTRRSIERAGAKLCELSVYCLLHGRKEGRDCLPVGLGALHTTHRNATRPVDWLMPSQVPSARTSRPESTMPLLLTSSWTAGTLSLEGAGMANGSNEWKCAGSVGRARYSSRFAHRMLAPPRSADESRHEPGA